MDKNYLEFLKELKQYIITSRYIATRLANKEQILLYYKQAKAYQKKAPQKNGVRKFYIKSLSTYKDSFQA